MAPPSHSGAAARRTCPLSLDVQDVLIHRHSDLNNLAKALHALPEGIAAMINEPGQTDLLAGLLHPMRAQLQQIANDMQGLIDGRLPGWYTD